MKNFKTLAFVALISTCLSDNQLNAWFPNIFGGTNTTCVNGNCNNSNGVKLTNGNEITDSGTIETKTMHIPGINTINISKGNLTITHCPTCEETLTITADRNVLPHLKTDTYKGRLSLGTTDKVDRPTLSPVTFHAVVRELQGISATNNTTVETKGTVSAKSLLLQASDGAKITAEVDTKRLTVEGVNNSTITVAGQTDTQIINLTKNSSYNASGLNSQETLINASNSSFGRVMTKRLVYDLIDKSTVFYEKNPSLTGKKDPSSTLKQARY